MFDKHQFEQLYRLYHKDCIRFAYSIMKNTVDAEEVVQEVFLKLWQKIGEINIETSSKGYLLTAIRNKAYEYFRKKASLPKIIAEEYAPANLSVNDFHFENKELDISIKQAINKLPEKCREVFLLSRYDQLKYKEIADKLDISIKTVENHIGKALKIVYSSVEHLLFIFIYFNILGVSIKFFI